MTAAVLPLTVRRQLRLAVVRSLQDALGDTTTIQSPGNWATPPEKLPALLVKAPGVRKQSNGRNVPQFTSTATIQVEGRLIAATPEEAQDAIERLEFKVEQAILTGYWINQVVQQFTSVNSDSEVTSEGKGHLAGFRMQIECETFEVFDATMTFPDETPWPPAGPNVVTDLQGVNLHVDAIQPADPNGTYTGPFPSSVTSAPRTVGPDGRDEGYLQIDLPQA